MFVESDCIHKKTNAPKMCYGKNLKIFEKCNIYEHVEHMHCIVITTVKHQYDCTGGNKTRLQHHSVLEFRAKRPKGVCKQ